MIDYRAGWWGFHVAFGINGSLVPRALAIAFPNAVITFVVSKWYINYDELEDHVSETAQQILAALSAVMLFILHNRSRISYNRWWEGGTLLQKARGEFFNSYSSIMAFTSTKPEMAPQVLKYTHLIARLMSLLFCVGLQQVSPDRDRSFEIIDLDGIDQSSLDFLNTAPDKVEIVLQWIQRSMVIEMNSGVLSAAPPILSRAFQEVSRGIVNLQNARKIADFPYPYPLAQISMILQILHWIVTPIVASMALEVGWAVLLAFVSIFVLWCIHFNALDLEFPFGEKSVDLPMDEFQTEWNKSVKALLDIRATKPPAFDFDPNVHCDIRMVMSGESADLCPPEDLKSRQESQSTMRKRTPAKGPSTGDDEADKAPSLQTERSAIERSVQSVSGNQPLLEPKSDLAASKLGMPASDVTVSPTNGISSQVPVKSGREGPDLQSSRDAMAVIASPAKTSSASTSPPPTCCGQHHSSHSIRDAPASGLRTASPGLRATICGLRAAGCVLPASSCGPWGAKGNP